MPFLALNAVEDEIRENQEKHTLEFQFEDALKLYERALQSQKDGDALAESLYLELLKFPLFDFERYKNVPPSTFRLKSLALKNYSIFMLDELQRSSDPDQAFAILRQVIDQLLGALALSHDPTVIEMLCSLAQYLSYPKLARVALEILVSDSTNRALSAAEALSSDNSKRLLGPKDEDMLARLRSLVIAIGDESHIPEFREYPAFRRNLSWLSKFKFENTLESLLSNLRNDTISISIPKRDISVLATSLEQALASVAKKRKKDLGDTYSYTLRPINGVSFVAPHGEAIVEDRSETEQKPLEEAANPAAEPESEQNQPKESTGNGENPAGPNIQPADDPTSPQPDTGAETPTQSVPSRQSARNKSSEFGVSAEFGNSDRVFIRNLAGYLALADLEYKNVLPAYEGTAVPGHKYLEDFKEVLERWDDENPEYFTHSGLPRSETSQPVMQMLDFAAMSHQRASAPGDELQGSELVDSMIEQLRTTSHIQQVRFGLLCSILGGSSPLIHHTLLPQTLLDTVGNLIQVFSAQLFELCRQRTEQFEPHLIPQLAQTVFEYYLDKFLSSERESRRNNQQKKSEGPRKKAVVAAAAAERESLRRTVEQWRGATMDAMTICPDTQVALRFIWAQIFFSQIEGDDPEETISKFQEFQVSATQDTLIEYSNFQTIPTASVQGAETQISKFRAASIFSKVFLPQETDEDVRDTIGLLEPMLMPETYEIQLDEAESIFQFLNTSSLEFKLSLWYLLLDSYERIGEAKKSLQGLTRILKSSIDECKSPEFFNKGQKERSYALLQCINVAYDISKRLYPLVHDNPELIDNEQPCEMLQYIIWLCEVLHIFTLTDQAINQNIIKAPQHLNWDKAVAKFRELYIRCWCLFYYYFRVAIPTEKRTNDVLNDILSIIHEQLGSLGYCGFADGMLLKLNINEILRLNWPESEADLLQCLNCLYGISLVNDAFTPFNHHAIPIELTRKDALKLTQFIMRMILNKKNLPQVIQRQNVRQVLDIFHQAIGAPDTSISQIDRNQSILEDFISQKPTLLLMKQCLRGGYQLSLSQSHDPTFSLIGAGGFYYVMALVHLNLYRIKRRTNPEKVDDLHQAIKFFKYDLTYGTNRFESWMGLSQANDHLCENGLIFVSPEVQNSQDFAAGFQSQAIMCACMAISVLPRSDPENALSRDYFHSLAEIVYAHIGKILYYSAAEPLSMAVYNAAPSKRFVYVDDKYEVSTGVVDRKPILKLAYHYLKAATSRPDDWFSLTLQAEVSHELSGNPSEIMDYLITASRKCARTPTREVKGGLDATFEPFQSIISFGWKFYSSGKFTGEQLLEYLKETGFPYDVPTTWSTEEVSKSVIQVIAGLTSADKKHWLHYPRYLQATIYETELQDPARAQQEMEYIISVKSVSKPLVQIWKPEYERPGQHFDFCRDYLLYYSDLLLKNRDEPQMSLFIRRVRKFQAVSNYIKVWNHALTNTVTLAKELIGLPRKYSERVVPTLTAEEFDVQSAYLEKWMAEQVSSANIDPWVLALDYAQDLKKLNIGLGSTVAVDNLVISLYLVLYTKLKPPAPTAKQETVAAAVVTPTPDPVQDHAVSESLTTTPFADAGSNDKKKLRVTRKDVLQKAAQALKPISSKLYPTKTDVKGIPKPLYGKGQELEFKGDDSKPPTSSVSTIPTPLEVIMENPGANLHLIK